MTTTIIIIIIIKSRLTLFILFFLICGVIFRLSSRIFTLRLSDYPHGSESHGHPPSTPQSSLHPSTPLSVASTASSFTASPSMTRVRGFGTPTALSFSRPPPSPAHRPLFPTARDVRDLPSHSSSPSATSLSATSATSTSATTSPSTSTLPLASRDRIGRPDLGNESFKRLREKDDVHVSDEKESQGPEKTKKARSHKRGGDLHDDKEGEPEVVEKQSKQKGRERGRVIETERTAEKNEGSRSKSKDRDGGESKETELRRSSRGKK